MTTKKTFRFEGSLYEGRLLKNGEIRIYRYCAGLSARPTLVGIASEMAAYGLVAK